MLTYAYVCMLTYADVCGRMQSVGRLIAAISPQHRLPLLEQLMTPILARLRALVGGPPAEFVRANVITEVH